ncbi:MAG: glycosyl hydrolase family 18 protein [Clostridia bacterium]
MRTPVVGKAALLAALPVMLAASVILTHGAGRPTSSHRISAFSPVNVPSPNSFHPPTWKRAGTASRSWSAIGSARATVSSSVTLHAVAALASVATNPPAVPAAASATAPAAGAAPIVLGYYIDGTAAWNDLVAHANQITAIAPFWYSFTVAGNLNDLGSSPSVTAFAHAHGIAVYPMVINGYGNNNMFQSAATIAHDVSTLARLAAQDNYDGFNVDFESLNNPDETGLDTFVSELAAALHQEGKKVIVSVGPRTSDQNGYHVYNYRSLGASADYIDLMLYDAHDNGGPAGPVAPMSWVDSIVQYAEATIPAPKILVGLAGYGYNWASDGSTEVSDNQALTLAAQYSAAWVGGSVDEWEITYTDASGYAHTVWFEDSRSEAYKVALVGEGGLGGVALWDLGEEDAGVWPMLAQDLRS